MLSPNNPVVIAARKLLDVSQATGEVVLLIRRTFSWMVRAPIERNNLLYQMVEMGNRTFPVASLTLVFTGMVVALQTGFSMIRVFNEPLYIGTALGHSIFKELSPVLTGMVFAGRVGAAIAAELGTMKVTEQLDALYTLGTNPVKYLAVPRFIAAITMLPLLVIYADLMGVIGGYIVAMIQLRIPSTEYIDDITNLDLDIVLHGFLKSFFFALIIVAVSCYKGFTTKGGAEGVGKATTAAVVISMVMILISDYFVSAVLVSLGIG